MQQYSSTVQYDESGYFFRLAGATKRVLSTDAYAQECTVGAPKPACGRIDIR